MKAPFVPFEYPQNKSYTMEIRHQVLNQEGSYLETCECIFYIRFKTEDNTEAGEPSSTLPCIWQQCLVPMLPIVYPLKM